VTWKNCCGNGVSPSITPPCFAGYSATPLSWIDGVGIRLPPRLITVDKHAAYAPAFEALQQEGTLPETCQLRQCKYLNNTVELGHRFVKCRVNPGLGFGAYATAQWIIQGYEVIYLLCTGQIEGMANRDVLAQSCVVNRMFGLAA
jgi:transposase, IS6 family